MAVLSGCSEEAPGREDGTLAGTIVNPATPVEQCQLLLKEDWAVGELDGPEAATFGNIIAYRVAADGTVLIVDNLNRNVRIVDAAGVVRATVGRQGDGPGEFGLPYRVAVNDSHFVVYDIGLNRFVRFDRNGRHLATAVAPFAMSGNMHIALAPNGHTYAGGRDAGIDAQIHELDQDFRLIRSFGALPGHADPGDAELLSWGALVADATGLWFSRAAAYSIQRYDWDGTLRASISRAHDWNYSPRPAEVRRPLEDGRTAIGFDADRPMNTGLAVDTYGYIWHVVRDVPNGRVVVDVFAATGEFLHSSEWPIDSAPGAVDSHRRFYRISRDRGYPQLIRLSAVNGSSVQGRVCADAG